ncbi:MAG: hypothetical protein PHE58_01745 [Candidatus Omnitrophica bacterium]|nr:hypothetical protein [Candidatus Omnitrophota bacterium]
MKKGLITLIIGVLFCSAVSLCFAADPKYVDVQAEIPSQDGLSVSISKVQNGTWSTDTKIDFGTLKFDNANKIFTGQWYYAVDVGVNSNAADWTIKHDVSSNVQLVGGTDTLNDNINVTFVKQLSSGTSPELLKCTLTESNGRSYTKSSLSGGWLRIYYGIATGESAVDAANVKTIGTDKPSGVYKGQVKITLSGV